MDEPLGLIAGGGGLPLATAQGMRAAGRRVVCVGLRGCHDPALPALCDHFATAGIAQIGRWCRLLRRWRVSNAVLVGHVSKTAMYTPMLLWNLRPDFRTAWMWGYKLRHDRRPDQVLLAVTAELQRDGVQLIDSTRYIPELLAGEGVMTRAQPSAAHLADIAFAMPIAQRMGDLDIGQAVAVRDREIIAVEAIEGTQRMIARAGELCRKGGWVLVKLAKPRQDMRFDVPTVGPATIEQLQAAGGRCLAIEAGKTIMLEKPKLLEAADRAGIAVIGVRVDGDAHAPEEGATATLDPNRPDTLSR